MPVLRRNLWIWAAKLKEVAYKAMVRPILEYTCSVQDPYIHIYSNTKKRIDMLENEQCRAARFVLHNYHSKFSITAIIDCLGWPSPHHCRKLAKLSKLYKMLHDDVRVDKSKLIPTAAHKERPLTAAFLDPMLHPEQAILAPAEHHEGLE